MRDSELRTRAKEAALKVIAICDTIDTRKGRGVLINQITRSATSVGANIHEANYASSKQAYIMQRIKSIGKGYKVINDLNQLLKCFNHNKK